MIVYGWSGVTPAIRSSSSARSRARPRSRSVVERDRVADVAGRVDDDDRLQRREVAVDLPDLGDLRRVLADDRARLGVARDPLALLGRVGRVDRDHDRAGARDAEVGVAPLRPRRAQDRDPVARLDPEVDEAATDLRHDLAELRVADVAPFAVRLVADRGRITMLRSSQADQVGDRGGARRRCMDGHRGAALHCSSSSLPEEVDRIRRALLRRAVHRQAGTGGRAVTVACALLGEVRHEQGLVDPALEDGHAHLHALLDDLATLEARLPRELRGREMDCHRTTYLL